jgi:hypothetical protein
MYIYSSQWHYFAVITKDNGHLAVIIIHNDRCCLRQCVPFSVYLGHIREMGRLYNATHVFLATDDESVVREARDVPGITVMHVSLPVSVLIYLFIYVCVYICMY